MSEGTTIITYSAVDNATLTANLSAPATFVVCLDKAPDDCEVTLNSLMEKAIKAYENRGPTLRHGIALDRQVTIILSQTDHEKPLCGIYFNLHSPYQKKAAAKPATKPVS